MRSIATSNTCRRSINEGQADRVRGGGSKRELLAEASPSTGEFGGTLNDCLFVDFRARACPEMMVRGKGGRELVSKQRREIGRG